MPASITQLVQNAGALANAGRWQEAELKWREINRLDPTNAKALFGLGVHAFQRGALTEARKWLEETLVQAPKDALAHLMHASICRAQNDDAQEFASIRAALVADPYCLPALLCKADWLERNQQRHAAAETYRNALKVASAPASWPATLRTQLEHGLAFVGQHSNELAAHLLERLAPLQQALPQQEQSRWREAADILSGQSKPFHSQCNQLHMPRLPAIPFFSREQFSWLPELEDKTEIIANELKTLLAGTAEGFTPYIAYAPGQPINQWAELNHSARWNAFHLWRSGVEVAENLQRCPETASILRQLQLVQIDGLCPNVMFSALAPHTHIPPHHGETNARLVAHLPLIVPDGCQLRVGHEVRSWTVGETLIFDDTIEHEASNHSDQLRVVLIFDVWNPLLTEDERHLVRAMAAAMREFGAIS